MTTVICVRLREFFSFKEEISFERFEIWIMTFCLTQNPKFFPFLNWNLLTIMSRKGSSFWTKNTFERCINRFLLTVLFLVHLLTETKIFKQKYVLTLQTGSPERSIFLFSSDFGLKNSIDFIKPLACCLGSYSS